MEKIHLLITRRGDVWRGVPRRGVPDARGRGPAVRGGASLWA